MHNRNKHVLKYRVLLRVLEILFFVFFFGLGGDKTIFFKDSERFITWSTLPYRKTYTLYPLFIKICRMIFGDKWYIDSIWIIQSIMAFISVIILADFFRQEYDLGLSFSMLVYVLLYLPFTFTLPEAVATHYIFTEGISLSLFYFSFFFLLLSLKKTTYKSVIPLCIFNVLLYMTRPQLIIVSIIYILLLVVRVLYTRYLKDRIRLRVLIDSAIILSLFFSVYFLLCILSGLIYDRPVENQLIDAISGKVICTIEEDNIEAIEERDKNLYKVIFEFVKENKTGIADFPDSWLDYEDIHVCINTNLRDYESFIADRAIENGLEISGPEYYKSRNRVLSRLLFVNRRSYIGIIVRLMPSSLVASIFFQPQRIRRVCYIISIVLYMISLIVLVSSLVFRIEERYRYPHIATLITIFLNALFCNITLYGQQRYVIYCMGLFYITLLIALIGCYRYYIDRKAENKNGSV